MARRAKRPQDYSPEEFDAAVKLIQSNADLRADIEAITGQKLADLTERRRRLRRAARERAA